jgi:branched-chain amino acid transport system permease protein
MAAIERANVPGSSAIKGRLLRRDLVLPALIFLFLAALPLAGLFIRDGYLLSLFTRVMIFAIAALALDLILGYGALVSFGHAAFMGIGAYAIGILSSHGIEDAFAGLAVALLAAGAFALVTGAISLRTKGVYFIMITLAFGQMAFFVAQSLRAYGGDDGLTLATRALVFGQRWLENDRVFYYVVLACLIGVYVLLRAVVVSRFGRVLSGARDNAQRMQAIGFNPYPYQLAAYVMAGMIGGLSGFLLANATEFVSPAFMSWQRSGELIVMVVLGGMGTLHGAVIGAAAFLLLEEWLSGFTEHWKVIFGPFLVLVVLFAKGGIMGLIGRVLGRPGAR